MPDHKVNSTGASGAIATPPRPISEPIFIPLDPVGAVLVCTWCDGPTQTLEVGLCPDCRIRERLGMALPGSHRREEL